MAHPRSRYRQVTLLVTLSQKTTLSRLFSLCVSVYLSLSVWLAAPTLSRTLSQKIKKKFCREYLHSLSLRIYSRADDSPLPFLSKKYISTSSSLSSRMSTVQKIYLKKVLPDLLKNVRSIMMLRR